jgi:hypothetical protein
MSCLFNLFREETQTVVGDPASNLTVGEARGHWRGETEKWGGNLMGIWVDEEVEENLVRIAIAEIDHVAEAVREGRLEAWAYVGVDLLAEVSKASGGVAVGGSGAAVRCEGLARVAKAAATTRRAIVLGGTHRHTIDE